MAQPRLYRGPWPQNVSKLAKYGVHFVDGKWKVAVLCDVGEGLRYLAVQHEREDLCAMVNSVKAAVATQPGGAFYVNEYRHVIVPVKSPEGSGTGSDYYFAGRLQGDLEFEYEGATLTTRPVAADGSPLANGAKWAGPRPGIPYVLAAGGADVYFDSPALTDDDPPAVRPMTTRKVVLSKVLGDAAAARRQAALVQHHRGHMGGRFYVNEHGAIFTPVSAGDGNGLDYIYCGDIDRSCWFPEPPTS